MKNLTFLFLIILSTGFWTTAARAGSVVDPFITLSNTATGQQIVTAMISINSPPPGTTLYYTTDGTNPSTSSPSITSGSSILLPKNATLRVEAFQTATATSNIITAKVAQAGSVSAGANHTLILKNDGSVWASGDNTAGELGTGNTTPSNQFVPVQTQGPSGLIPLTGIVAIAAGAQQSFAVDNQGHLWAWGQNSNSQLGLGNNNLTYLATQISNLSGIVAVASSNGHHLALTGKGAVYGWGANGNGQAGTGATSTWVTTPTLVIAPTNQTGPTIQNIVAIATGYNHSLALENTGKVYAWGDNSYGELGNGDTSLAQQLKPVYVKVSGNPFTGVVGIVADATNSFAIQGNGNVFAWGDNTIGELGNGTSNPATPVIPANLSPAQVTTNLSGAMAVVGNQSALGQDGNVWAWGDNTNARLGIGVSGYYATAPVNVNVSGAATPTVAITSGNNQTVNDGAYSNGIVTTASGSNAANAWITYVINPTSGLWAYATSGAVQSPILAIRANGSGVTPSLFLHASTTGSGSVTGTVVSGTSQAVWTGTLNAIQQLVTGEPLPEWVTLMMAVLVIYFVARQRTRLIG